MAKKETPSYDHLKQFANDVEGYEGINMNTMAIPFIRILQSLSPQLKKSKAEYIAEADEGDICNSINGTLYTRPLRVVIGKFERLFIEWKPNRGGYVAAHAPEEVENNPQYVNILNDKGSMDLIDKDSKNQLFDTYMYYVMLPDYLSDEICIIALASTFLKEARRLNRMLMTTYIPGTSQKAAPHMMVWELDTVEMTKGEHSWFGPKFTFKEFVTPDLLESVMAERKAIPNKQVDYAQLEETSSSAKEQDTSDVKY